MVPSLVAGYILLGSAVEMWAAGLEATLTAWLTSLPRISRHSMGYICRVHGYRLNLLERKTDHLHVSSFRRTLGTRSDTRFFNHVANWKRQQSNVIISINNNSPIFIDLSLTVSDLGATTTFWHRLSARSALKYFWPSQALVEFFCFTSMSLMEESLNSKSLPPYAEELNIVDEVDFDLKNSSRRRSDCFKPSNVFPGLLMTTREGILARLHFSKSPTSV